VIDITIQNGGVLVVLGKVRSTDNNFDIRINSATGVLVSVNAVELGPTQISSQGDIYVVATPTGIDPGDFMASSPDQTVQDQNALLANQPDIFSFMVAYGFTPLPVELTSFSATSHDGGAFIDWSTASETNNDFFTIERSSDAVKWVGVAVVDGAGTSSLVHNYSYVDNNVPGGVTYYRIKQTDFDGNFSYSPVQSVKVTIPTTIIEFTTFPNPVSTLLYVESNFPVAKLTIYGADKRVVGVYETLPVDVSTLPPGVYTIVAEDTSARTTIQEFVKQ
jgi:hypothetical protein